MGFAPLGPRAGFTTCMDEKDWTVMQIRKALLIPELA